MSKIQEKLRVITMSSGKEFKGLESEFKRVSSNVGSFGALQLSGKGYTINLEIPHIAVDILLEPVSKVVKTKRVIKPKKKK